MTTYVAVSTDPSDRQVYAGPVDEPVPNPPEGRQWIEEYRAMAAGYWYPPEYSGEEWSAQARDVARQSVRSNAQQIQDALRRHLQNSNAALAALPDPPTLTNAQVVRALIRHERGLNLLIRAMIEVFDQAPPAYVTKDES